MKNKEKLIKSDTPFYQQLYHLLKNQIVEGKWKNNEQIPTEAELGNHYGVSRIVVREAVSLLEKEGLVKKAPGKGTFVTYTQIVESFVAGGSFSKSCIQKNIHPTTKIIKREIADSIHLPAHLEDPFDATEKIVVERLRYADDVPVIYEIDCFPINFDFMMHEEIDKFPIMEIIERNTGMQSSYSQDIIDIAFAESHIASGLSVNPSSPVLRVFQEVYSKNDQLIYFNTQYINASYYKYAVSYQNSMS